MCLTSMCFIRGQVLPLPTNCFGGTVHNGIKLMYNP